MSDLLARAQAAVNKRADRKVGPPNPQIMGLELEVRLEVARNAIIGLQADGVLPLDEEWAEKVERLTPQAIVAEHFRNNPVPEHWNPNYLKAETIRRL